MPGLRLVDLFRPTVLLALALMAVIVMMILPMPPLVLDIGLAASFAIAILIFTITLFIERPLDFSAFPTILLASLMLRLSLNVSSTKLIIGQGHTGTDAAGDVIEGFAMFIMSGSVLIGLVVFGVLLIVNFVVITKGSGRIAEVGARFTLDAMPGKQMAIDADLSAGLIDEKEARIRRKRLEEESNFYGAMDGASKFVRGDAIAGIIITVINIIGGIIIGVVQQGMALNAAASSYTILTVGDGLVSQIPALVVSTAAGLMVSKAGVDGAADKALFGQLSGYPQALGMSSFVMFVMSLLPGIPTLIFMGLSGATGYLAWQAAQTRETKKAAEAAAKEASAVKPPTEEPIATALAMDYLRVELGYGLLPLINDTRGYKLTDQIKTLRRTMAGDMGFVMPAVRILDNMQLGANEYVIRVKEQESGRGELFVGQLLVMDPRGADVQLPGTPTREPAFGLPAAWIEEGFREEASFRGYTVVDPATVLVTHLTEILKDHMPELLSYAETKKLMDELPPEHKKLVDDLVPSQISITTVQRVLQSLLAERVSIRDLPTILEGIAEMAAHTQNVTTIREHVRARLARQLCAAASQGGGYLPLISLSPAWEQTFAEALIGPGEEKQLSIQPSRLQEFIGLVRQRFDQAAVEGESPVLLTSPGARPYVRSIIERFRAQTTVMSQNEIHPSARLRTLGQI